MKGGGDTLLEISVWRYHLEHGASMVIGVILRIGGPKLQGRTPCTAEIPLKRKPHTYYFMKPFLSKKFIRKKRFVRWLFMYFP